MNVVETLTRQIAHASWANSVYLSALQDIATPPARAMRWIAHVLAAEELWQERLLQSGRSAVARGTDRGRAARGRFRPAVYRLHPRREAGTVRLTGRWFACEAGQAPPRHSCEIVARCTPSSRGNSLSR